jgi:malonyl-CoA O-methyltransferase
VNTNQPPDKPAAKQHAHQQAVNRPSGRFDKSQVRDAFDRAAHRYDHSAVLQQEVTERLLEKLDVVRIAPAWILDAGCGTGSALPGLAKRYSDAQLVALDISRNMLTQCAGHGGMFNRPMRVCADMEQLPFASDSFDLIFSSLSLQWCNDLDAAFNEAFRVLRPGGLYVFASFGPDTLKELRESWRRVDGRVHVNRFEDMHDVGDALLRDGFAEPVMEAEIITMTYQDTDTIMKDLKSIGASVKERSGGYEHDEQMPGLGGRDKLCRLRDEYEGYRKDGVLPVSYEIIYGHAWKFVDDRTRKVVFSP